MRKEPCVKSLVVKSETLRRLTPEELQKIAGLTGIACGSAANNCTNTT